MKIMRIEWIADDNVKATLPETVEFEDGDDLSKKEIFFCSSVSMVIVRKHLRETSQLHLNNCPLMK